MAQYTFPILQNVQIKFFSLYRKKSDISVSIGDGVFCLAGANGLGKSTFINIVNYALTGIVKRPEREFSQSGSIPKFYSDSKSFAAKYFDRRIDESYRDVATVTIDFVINDYKFKLSRGFFEPDAIEFLSIVKSDIEQVDATSMTDYDRNQFYKSKLVEAIGLQDFDQFVFLQIFVFTFDESHQLLFWDPNLMERVLYLFFNLDPSKAKMADQLRKDITTHESNMRNLQWDATQKEKELTSILNQVELDGQRPQEIDKKLIDDYQELSDQLSDCLDNINQVDSEVKECDLLLADLSLKSTAKKAEYETIFNSTFNKEVPLEQDPEILKFLKIFKQAICSGSEINSLFENFQNYILKTKCSQVTESDENIIKSLQQMDEELFKISNEINQYSKRKERVIIQYNELRNLANDIKKRLEEIEKGNENFLIGLYTHNNSPDISLLITNMRGNIDSILENKKEETKKRDQRRLDLKALEKDLNHQYLNAEETFLPIFIDYAKNFLGLDINVYMQTSAKGARLILEVSDTERREKYQLSESQRYFIDIALRMALIQYSSNKAAMMIDTPEGSLDIAYESRAGTMFADFTKKGFDIIMTANINSSMLLKKLAGQCKSRGMTLENMTEWTELSDVQLQEQTVINDAFNEIGEILNS